MTKARALVVSGVLFGIGLAIAIAASDAVGQQSGAPVSRDSAKDRIDAELRGELWIADPIWLFGPYPSVQHACKIGDLYQFQIRYPIAPPFPKRVKAFSDSPAAIPTEAVRTSGQVAFLTSTPQTSTGLGVGHFSIFVKAAAAGKAKVTVEVTMDDGAVETLPFLLTVNGTRPTMRHGALESGTPR